ncbi:MAG TPA: hypothetical protein DCF63_08385 [Planctomycetaceae bacterium]|nr:hypothetical protein [Planctomycetaceae bacterium]
MLPIDLARTTFYRWLMLILLCALLLRVLAAVAWHRQATAQENFLRLGDSHGYWALAECIAKGQPYQYGDPPRQIFRTPLLPLVLAPLTQLDWPSQAVFCARCLGAVLGTLAVALVAALAERIAGTTAALIAAMIAAVYPAAIGMSILVLSEMLFMPLMLGSMLSWMLAYQADSTLVRSKWAVGGGLIAGLAVLTRPSWLLFAPFATLIGFVVDSRRRVHLEIAVLSGLCICLVMTPWWIRNAGITGKFVPTTLQTGASLYDGLHQGASGASDEGMLFMQEIEHQQAQEDALTPQPLESTFEWRVNQRAKRLALQWAGQNPMQSFDLMLSKFWRTWSLWPDGGDLSSGAMRAALTISTICVLLLAFLANWHFSAGREWMIAFYWMPCLYFTALHLVFVGSIRYREPAMLVLVALAGCEVAKWFHKTQTVKTVTCAAPSSTTPPVGKSSID